MPYFGHTSTRRLHECDFQLQRLFNEVIKIYNCTVLEGRRDQISQDALFDSGKSEVKWPDGKHNKIPSEAIDAAPWPIPKNWGEDHWKDMVIFYEFAAIVRYEASKLGIKIRWGGDWDGDGDYKDQTFDDLIHFELVK